MCRSLQLASLAAALMVLAGCGNKGPLFMPPPKAATVTPAKPAAPAAVPAKPAAPAPASSTVTQPAMPTPDMIGH